MDTRRRSRRLAVSRSRARDRLTHARAPGSGQGRGRRPPASFTSRDPGADRRLGFGLQRAENVLRLALEARDVRGGAAATA